MKYRFIGADGSMGYKHGKVYTGRIFEERYDGSLLFVTGAFPFFLFNVTIPYDSKELFNRNWQLV